MLKKNTGKSLVSPVITRWSSLVMTYARILEVFDEFVNICTLCNWTPLSDLDRRTMQLIVEILDPFREITTRLQCEKYPTISMVYPAIVQLIQLLEVRFLIISSYYLRNLG